MKREVPDSFVLDFSTGAIIFLVLMVLWQLMHVSHLGLR